MRTGLVGCGVVGRILGARLLRAGYPLKIHDKDAACAPGLLDAGASWADSPRAAAEGCELIVTALPGPQETEAVSLDEEGLWSAVDPETIHVETSTVGPRCVRRLARAAKARGIRYLDAPLSRGALSSRGARIVQWVGGDANVFDRARPALEVLADHVTYCGSVGHGQVTKLVNNLVTQSLTVVLGEALSLGVRAGVQLDMLCTALHSGTAQSRLLDELLPLSVLRGNWKPGLRLELAVKDLALAREVAAELEMELPVADLVAGFYERAGRRGWGDLSAHAVVRLAEEAFGVTLRSAVAEARDSLSEKDRAAERDDHLA